MGRCCGWFVSLSLAVVGVPRRTFVWVVVGTLVVVGRATTTAASSAPPPCGWIGGGPVASTALSKRRAYRRLSSQLPSRHCCIFGAQREPNNDKDDWEPTLLAPKANNANEEEEEEGGGNAVLWEELTRNLVSNGQGPASLVALRQRLQEKQQPEQETARPSKSDLYSTDQLEQLLATHQQLTSSLSSSSSSSESDKEDASFGSLHDMVSQMVQEENNDKDSSSSSSSVSSTSFSVQSVWNGLSLETRERIQKVRAVASDVDGTILTSQQTIHPRTLRGIQEAVAMTQQENSPLQHFFPATGKSRKGALDSLGPVLGPLLAKVPGVFLQGLYCVDRHGQVLLEQRLPSPAIAAAAQLVRDYNVSIVAYDGDDLYTTEYTDTVHELHEKYGEPQPVVLSMPTNNDKDATTTTSSGPLSRHAPGFHKILILHADPHHLTTVVRPALQDICHDTQTRLTQALPTMLELLPGDGSKARGVAKVCEALGIAVETELMAMGDAENDVELLQMASLGICMANGSPVAQNAADHVLAETNNQGGAGVALEIFGGIAGYPPSRHPTEQE